MSNQKYHQPFFWQPHQHVYVNKAKCMFMSAKSTLKTLSAISIDNEIVYMALHWWVNYSWDVQLWQNKCFVAPCLPTHYWWSHWMNKSRTAHWEIGTFAWVTRHCATSSAASEETLRIKFPSRVEDEGKLRFHEGTLSPLNVNKLRW